MSYIKPQLAAVFKKPNEVVYRLCPTSNHNLFTKKYANRQLYIAYVLHQTTTQD